MTSQVHRIAILIVNFRNPHHIRRCLIALSAAAPEPAFHVFICENGGEEAFDELKAVLRGPQGPCSHEPPGDSPDWTFTTSGRLAEVEHLSLRGLGSCVWVTRAIHNLGYAGAVNAMTDQLREYSDWHGIWILNPDAEPTPNALAKLTEYSAATGKGMVGSTILDDKSSDRIACRGGLHWSRFTWRTMLVGSGDPIDAPFDSRKLQVSLDCASGASMYVSRKCVEAIGPMDERFFLYYEDVDWGMRAKPWGIGYAPDSLVFHRSGSTIGSSSWRRKDRSWLSIYLENRNRIHFVRKHYPLWLPLAIITAPRFMLPYLFVGAWADFKIAVQGCLAGLRGEFGPPSRLPPSFLARQSPAESPHFGGVQKSRSALATSC